GSVRADNWDDCKSDPPDTTIRGCTRVISNSRETPHNRAVAFSNRGRAYRIKGDWDRAMADYNESLELDPRLSNAHLGRGLVLAHRENYDLAIEEYDKAIELDPDNAWAYGDRGWVHNWRGEDTRAITDYTKAIELDPTEAYFFNGRCWAYYLLGDLDHALSDCKGAIETAGGTPIRSTAGAPSISKRSSTTLQSKIVQALSLSIRRMVNPSSTVATPSILRGNSPKHWRT